MPACPRSRGLARTALPRALLARFWWGSVFLINVPIAVLGAACALWLIPDSRNPAAQAPDLAGLAIPSATESVVGSVPAAHTGVGSATNGAFLQIGGALGVAVIGSLLNTRYQDTMTSTLAPYHVPHAVMQAVLGSVGGALEVAARAGGVLGAELSHLARTAFASGMDLGLTVGACVAAAGCLVALLTLPSREPGDGRRQDGE